MISRSDRERSRYTGGGHRRGRYRWAAGTCPHAILIFHGYLLRGTGSNIYNATSSGRSPAGPRGAPALPGPQRRRGLVDAVGAGRAASWRDDPRAVHRTSGAAARLRGRRYEGFDAGPYPELTTSSWSTTSTRTSRAVREVAERIGPDVALANHLVMGPGDPRARARRAGALRGQGPRQRARVHGAPPPRALPALRAEGLRGARGPRGSRHTAESLWEVMDDAGLPGRTRLGPPGVDVHTFLPRPPEEAAAGSGARGPPRVGGRRRLGRRGGRRRRAAPRSTPRRDRIVSFVGKLIVSKGVDLLFAAWPLVVEACRRRGSSWSASAPTASARTASWMRSRRATSTRSREIAARGRELEGGPPGELRTSQRVPRPA